MQNGGKLYSALYTRENNMSDEKFFFYMTCIDPRPGIRRGVRELKGSLGISDDLGNCDHVQVAGGAQSTDVLNTNLAIAIEHHGVTEVVLTIHEDCKAEANTGDLTAAGFAAKAVAADNRIEITLQLFIIKLDGNWEEISLRK
jgi:carbonic anhydrase